MEEKSLQLSETLELIKDNQEARNEFIAQYQPFIASFCYELTHRYLEYGVDDELQIAMMAFNEAIEKYNGKGNFLLFAKVTMKSRLFDYFKSSAYRERQTSYAIYDEEDKEIDALKNEALDQYQKSYEDHIRVMEINLLNEQLKEYGISFADLVTSSPKHLLSRHKVNSMIEKILEDEEICFDILEEKVLPLKKIEKNLGIPRKKFELYRKYIIAVIVIEYSEFDTLKTYLPIRKKGGKR